MKTIYIDNDCKCHVTPSENMRSVETSFFDGKCDVVIEGFRYIPPGESWTRSDGIVFNGEVFTAWKPYSELKNAQEKYEQEVRIATLEKDNAALKEETAMLMQCILEMSEMVYA